jgi:hypothetical protein
MSYKQQIIEWDVPLSEVTSEAIGYEIEFSSNHHFYPVQYVLSTFDTLDHKVPLQGTFFYSLDNGVNWVDYPLSEQGQLFTTAYKMRVILDIGNIGYIFAEKNGTIYKITGDGKKNVGNYTISDFTSSAFENDGKNNLYIGGQNKTLYKIDSDLKPSNSINIHNNPLGITIDSSRNQFWQIDKTKIYLKDLEGDTIFSLNLPFEIDEDFSSSSESTSSSTEIRSSSSSSSTWVRSSSSSSYDDVLSVTGNGNPSYNGIYNWNGVRYDGPSNAYISYDIGSNFWRLYAGNGAGYWVNNMSGVVNGVYSPGIGSIFGVPIVDFI